MADWTKLGGRGNVEDRRGASFGALGGGMGLVGVGIVLLINILSGGSVDVGTVLQQLSQASQQSSLTSQEFEGEDNYERFASTVLGSANETWQRIFADSGKQYEEPRLVLFRSATQSGCGVATSQVGPHYCPADQTIYLDETFFDLLRTKLGATGGDVAEAYVLAHEVGHHVQHQLGLIDTTGSTTNAESVRLELQADCFAGIWAYSIKQLNVFEPGEIREAMDAAAAVGDDRIQAKVQGQVDPETWTHGSSDQRVKWFTVGYESGDPSACTPPLVALSAL